MLQKIITGVCMWIAIPAVIWLLPEKFFDVLVLAIIFWGLFELARMKYSDRIERWSVIVGAMIIAASFMLGLESKALIAVLSGMLFLFSLMFMWRTKTMEGVAEKLAFAVFCCVYIGMTMPFWSFMRSMENGRWLVLLALATSGLTDTFAYLIGCRFGKRLLAPIVSPKKTVEGLVGALAGSMIGAFAILFVGFDNVPIWHAAVIGAVVWVLAPFGDLIESMIKRSFRIKDSGTLLKSHGGILDRLDALVFTGPFVFAYAKYVLHS